MPLDGTEIALVLVALVLAMWFFAPLWNSTVGSSVAFLKV
jgi:hypothetical protein